ncbi:acyl-coenzyme A thioesterase 13-like [Lutzomyia longipalpis]|uniref:acyl-coenzyme A thioesterase 13-like n=1 Tax=Lutzomyia longipalpis TaxID=7200 RepID=UPI00248456CF|nr:acyl-coenzyme A thioesterase 13-like [Lutzomyia longipalpis]
MSSAKRGVDFVRAIVKYMATDGSFSTTCLKNVEIVAGGEGKIKAEFKVLPEHLNSAGGLHGGFTASLIDILTSVALMSNNSHPGVSVDLRVSYLKGAREGDSVIVDATTIKAGRKMAFLECELKHKSDGSLIARGGQTKFVDLGPKEDYTTKLPE